MNGSVALLIRRTVKAPVQRVYEAWTLPEQLMRWWGPRPVTCSEAHLDVRVGGSYRIGNLLPDGAVLFIHGEFEVVEPPHRLVYTWFLERPDGTTAEASRVVVRFEPHEQGTEIILVHERIESEALSADHERGWQGCLDNLTTLLG